MNILGDWWHSNLLDQPYGCRIHNNANRVNYVFQHDRFYALDFESSWDHASSVHDLGIIAAELKHSASIRKTEIEQIPTLVTSYDITAQAKTSSGE
jgi:hypothetical protein